MAQRRLQAFIAYRAAGGKGSIDSFWPMKKAKKKGDVITVDKDLLSQIMKTHNLV